MPNLKAIATSYNGYRFRSRLEARWAVFFSALGLVWEYEPEGFDLGEGVYYLPDFKVHYPDGDYWFEVKPAGPMSAEDLVKIEKFSTMAELIVLIGPPEFKAYPISSHGKFDSENTFGAFLWSYKKRPWFDDMANFLDLCEHIRSDAHIKIKKAANVARSARFEHGDCPSC